MIHTITLLDFTEQPILTLREIHAVGDLPAFFGKAYSSIMEYLGEIGQYPSGMPFATYYNLDMQNMDVEAGFPVSTQLPGRGEIKASHIPAGKYVRTIYEGPYDSMEPVYKALSDWAKQNGHELPGITYEYYLNDPSEKPGIVPMTEIRLAVK